MHEVDIRTKELHREQGCSIAHVVLRGLNNLTVNHESDTQYIVEDGVGEMLVGNEIVELYPGVEATVPKGIPYQDIADKCLSLVAISRPAFNPDSVEVI